MQPLYTSAYQLTLIANTETALNCDVTCDEQYLGRLYVFPTTDSALHALGIEKEWFLAHESGEFVVSGHINTVGEWCVSSHRSLEPNLKFTSQAEVFDKIFSSDYEREVLAFREMLSHESSSSILHQDLNNDMLSHEPNSSILSQDLTLNLNSLVSGSASGNEDEEEDDSKPIVEPILVTINNELNIPNLEVLKELLLHSSVEELEELSEDLARQSDELQEVSEVALIPDVVMEEEHLLVDEKVDQKFSKLEVLEVQDTLIDRVLEEYQKQETREFAIPPFGLVTVHVEEEYFVLHSAHDGHTMMAATLQGEVLEELDESDAAVFEEVLKQLSLALRWEQSQVEVSRFESLPGEEFGDSAKGFEMNAKDDDLANRNGRGKNSKEIEYGD
jgi:hypothetical protein